MIKISHETPKCLLKDSKHFCDYQYALVHLLEEDKEYRSHFIKCRDEGTPIYLDNSLHELGYAVGGEILQKWVNILKPKYVFVPDVWEDKNETLINALHWINYDYPRNTTPIAVVQAKSYEEAQECYLEFKSIGYKKIAFSYGASYYNDLSKHPNKDIGKALGRITTISKLFDSGVITETDKIHLLGCASPFEFSLYKDMPFIDSIDTSNPVMAALEGKKYNHSLVMDKPKANMNSFFNISLGKIDLELVKYNTNKFISFLEV